MKRSPLWIILLVAFVDLTGFGLIIPLQAVYADRLGASGLTLGLMMGAYSFMQLLFNPILGRWSDRVGRRRVLLISIGGSVAAHVLLGVADLAASLPLLFAARVLDGITGANVATAQAYIADVTTGEDRARGMGLFGAAFGLGFVVGPGLGAGLAFVGRMVSGPLYGTSWPAFGAAAISLAALVLVWRFLPESRSPAGDPRQRFRILNLRELGAVMANPRLRELFTLSFFNISAFVLLEVTFVYLLAHRFGVTELGTGLIFVYVGVLMILVQGGLVGRMVRAFGEPALVARGPFINALAGGLGFDELGAVGRGMPADRPGPGTDRSERQRADLAPGRRGTPRRHPRSLPGRGLIVPGRDPSDRRLTLRSRPPLAVLGRCRHPRFRRFIRDSRPTSPTRRPRRPN
jgi:DHA1 family tetracycline resistance protein-like MFS transporter